MATPKVLTSVRQLRWLLAKGAAGARWKQLAHACMSGILALIAQAPVAEDATESPVVPLPNVIRHLSSPACLPHVVQLLLTQDPMLVRDASAVTLHVAASHSQVRRGPCMHAARPRAARRAPPVHTSATPTCAHT